MASNCVHENAFLGIKVAFFLTKKFFVVIVRNDIGVDCEHFSLIHIPH